MPKSYIPSVTELQAFVACARHGTTVLAAERLHLTQSAVSRSLGALEERLGVPLFDRLRRRLVLSPAGRSFLDRAERILADLGEAATSVIAFGGDRAVLRIAVLPSFGRSWLIPRLPRLAERAPGLTVDIAARLSPVDFTQEPFDLAIMRSQHGGPGTRGEAILAEELVIVAAPSLLAGRAALDSDSLLALPLLQQSTRPTLWLDWFRDTPADPRRILRGARFDHFDMVVDAAAAGLGVGIVPWPLVRRELERGTLRLASPRRYATGESYALILPAAARDEPHVLAFRDWLLDEIAAG